MARGKNYVNNNRGLHLQAGSKSGGFNGKTKNQMMQLCEYGAGCTRPDCIYRHDGGRNGGKDAVCVLFLAGKCSFKDKGCRKRHPNKEEAARLLAKYKKVRCRFGDDCYTDSCLFLHPRDVKDKDPVAFIEPHHFPPLHNGPGPSGAVIKPIPNSAWNSAPVGVQGKNAAPSEVAATTANPAVLPQEQGGAPYSEVSEMPGPPPPSPNPNVQSPPSQNQPQPHMPPQGAWGYPSTSSLMVPPPPVSQQYYGNGPMHQPHNMMDPHTGYPFDPQYFDQQQQQQQYHDPGMMYHQGMAFVPNPYGMPMAVPIEATHFNAEAKEFIPGDIPGGAT